jgi:hypothetical protein
MRPAPALSPGASHSVIHSNALRNAAVCTTQANDVLTKQYKHNLMRVWVSASTKRCISQRKCCCNRNLPEHIAIYVLIMQCITQHRHRRHGGIHSALLCRLPHSAARSASAKRHGAVSCGTVLLLNVSGLNPRPTPKHFTHIFLTTLVLPVPP